MSGDPYIKENERLEAEIADLQSANKLLHNLIANREAEIARLQDEEANDAQTIKSHADEIRRLQELLRGTGANRYWEGRWRDADAENQKLRAALERLDRQRQIAERDGNPVPHWTIVEACQALAKEGVTVAGRGGG